MAEQKELGDYTFDEWHDTDAGYYECGRCERDISPSDYHDTGLCIPCLESDEFEIEDW